MKSAPGYQKFFQGKTLRPLLNNEENLFWKKYKKFFQGSFIWKKYKNFFQGKNLRLGLKIVPG